MRSRGAALLAACACQSPPAAVDVDADPDELGGGTLAVPGCGYDVRIGIGATPPALPGDFVGVDPEPRRIHLGIAGDPRTSMVVSWQTDDRSTEAGEVRFGTGTLDRVVPGITWRYRDTRGGTFRMHEAHLCGLSPDTVHRYRVHSGPAASPERAFRTAPGPDDEVVVAALGDSRGDPATFGALVALADGFAPDLYL
ncbi:MAG: fibronectin type III domain-containing protein, partial [Actinomycetota bacterium]